jgi:hypothetical protein
MYTKSQSQQQEFNCVFESYIDKWASINSSDLMQAVDAGLELWNNL